MVYISKNIALVLFCPFLSRFSISTNRKQSKLEDPDFLGGWLRHIDSPLWSPSETFCEKRDTLLDYTDEDNSRCVNFTHFTHFTKGRGGPPPPLPALHLLHAAHHIDSNIMTPGNWVRLGWSKRTSEIKLESLWFFCDLVVGEQEVMYGKSSVTNSSSWLNFVIIQTKSGRFSSKNPGEIRA